MNPENTFSLAADRARRGRTTWRLWLIGVALLALGYPVGAASAATAAPPPQPSVMPLATTGTTVITSRRLEFDNRKRQAVFEGNVLVQDATMRMRTDRLMVFFDEAEQPSRIEAAGSVVIMQENRLARSQAAVYDIVAGTMVLTGSAEVRRGRDLLKGDTITFWRDQDRIEVVPGMLILSPEARDP